MAVISKPTDINKVWASAGDVLTPSDTKIATGWQVEIPPRQYFNYIDQKQDYAIAHINQHGVAVWDNVTEYQANKSYTQGPTNGTIYRCVSTHSNQNPETDLTNTYWQIAFAGAGDFYTKTETDNLYLAKTQNLADLPNPATARTNLSVYSQAQTYTKTEVDAKTTVASQAQAEAGVSNTVIMTPLRTAQAIAALQTSIGIGQTWQDVTGSRTSGTLYTNSTGKPIQVAYSLLSSSTSNLTIEVGGVTIYSLTGVQFSQSMSFIVPNGATYRITVTNVLSAIWAELR